MNMKTNKLFSGILSFIPKKMTDTDIVTYRVVAKYVNVSRYQHMTQILLYPMEFTRKWYQRKQQWNFIKEFKSPYYRKVYFLDSHFVEKYLQVYHQKKNPNVYVPIQNINFDRYSYNNSVELDVYGRVRECYDNKKAYEPAMYTDAVVARDDNWNEIAPEVDDHQRNY